MDNHHAAASGQKFETKFAKILWNRCQLTVLNLKESFKRHGLMELYNFGKIVPHTPEWSEDPRRVSGKRNSRSDGVIKELLLPFEHKGANDSGTTEEKIWWEEKKIRLGITPNRYLFVFSGILENEFHAMHFMREIDNARNSGDERFKYIYCVRESQLTLEWLNTRYAHNIPVLSTNTMSLL